MKTLYNEYEMLSDDGIQLCRELQEVIGPLISRWITLGYLLREIEAVIINDIHVTFCEELLRNAVDKNRAERAK